MAGTSTIRRWTANYHWLPAFSRSPAGPTAQHHSCPNSNAPKQEYDPKINQKEKDSKWA
jgi:hypothetical protein